jgi:DNA primase
LEYLMDRGLTTRTIRDARLGYVPGDFCAFRNLHGLRVPCGITLPWLDEDKLWSVKARRAAGEVKYAHIAGGSGSGLYNADALTDATMVVLCEGEFDALLLQQEAGDRLTAVTLGSAAARLTPRWLPHLLAMERIFIAYDADEAGQRGATYLGSMIPHAQRLSVPMGKDITDFYLQRGDLYAWISDASRPEQSEIT